MLELSKKIGKVIKSNSRYATGVTPYEGYDSEDNLRTKVNYDPNVEGILSAAVFLAAGFFLLRPLERSPYSNIPNFTKGHLFDYSGAIGTAALSRGLFVDKRAPLIESGAGIAGPSLLEIVRDPRHPEGVFDPLDFVAYGLGAASWYGIHKAAKFIHDKGYTLPIYRRLGIKHRLYD